MAKCMGHELFTIELTNSLVACICYFYIQKVWGA